MMGETFTVELSGAHFQILKKMADRLGKQPGELGAEWVVKALQRVVEDPLYQFAGAVRSGVPDLAERHDFYLGQAIVAEMREGHE